MGRKMASEELLLSRRDPMFFVASSFSPGNGGNVGFGIPRLWRGSRLAITLENLFYWNYSTNFVEVLTDRDNDF